MRKQPEKIHVTFYRTVASVNILAEGIPAALRSKFEVSVCTVQMKWLNRESRLANFIHQFVCMVFVFCVWIKIDRRFQEVTVD